MGFPSKNALESIGFLPAFCNFIIRIAFGLHATNKLSSKRVAALVGWVICSISTDKRRSDHPYIL